MREIKHGYAGTCGLVLIDPIIYVAGSLKRDRGLHWKNPVSK